MQVSHVDLGRWSLGGILFLGSSFVGLAPSVETDPDLGAGLDPLRSLRVSCNPIEAFVCSLSTARTSLAMIWSFQILAGSVIQS